MRKQLVSLASYLSYWLAVLHLASKSASLVFAASVYCGVGAGTPVTLTSFCRGLVDGHWTSDLWSTGSNKVSQVKGQYHSTPGRVHRGCLFIVSNCITS